MGWGRKDIMRKKYLFGRCRCKLPMELQKFAEGDGSGADDGNGSGSGSEGDDASGGDEPPTFDDFLKGEGNQAEFDRRMQKAIEKSISKNNEKWQVLTDEKLSEAEKLAKMTKEEAVEYQRKQKEKALAGREADITKRELMAEAKVTLADKGLPAGLAEMLIYTDADSCKASIAALDKAFKAALDKAVEERIKGGKPPKKPGDNGTEEGSASAFVSIIKENQSKR